MRHPVQTQSKHHLGVRDEGEISQPPEQRRADGSPEPVRWERVRQARRALKRGDYSDPQVLDAALARMLHLHGLGA